MYACDKWYFLLKLKAEVQVRKIIFLLIQVSKISVISFRENVYVDIYKYQDIFRLGSQY